LTGSDGEAEKKWSLEGEQYETEMKESRG
jgi:hypothetical protein